MASTHDEEYLDALPQLMAAHPLLFADREFEIPSELPSGWFSIADRLSGDLEALLGSRAVHWQPIQSKEKFGSWRLYWRLNSNGDDPDDDGASTKVLTADVQVPSGIATDAIENSEISTTPAGYRISLLPAGELRRAVHARVRRAEQETERTCLWCGEPGSYWTSGWVHVACVRHRRRDAIPLEAWHKLQAIRRQKYERGRGKKKREDDGGSHDE